MDVTAREQTQPSLLRDMVMLSMSGVDCHAENQMRLTLRKKNIRLLMVKNSLCRRVFDDLGLPTKTPWEGPTVLAWGAGSIAELSRSIDEQLKNPKTAPVYKDKVKIKGAVAEGQSLGFEEAKIRPTREEALAAVLAAILGPAAQIAGCLTGPAAQVASQIQTISEKKEEAAPLEGAAPAEVAAAPAAEPATPAAPPP